MTTPVRPEVSSELEEMLTNMAAKTFAGWYISAGDTVYRIWTDESEEIHAEPIDPSAFYEAAPVPRSGITATGREADPGRPKEPPK